MKIIRHLGLAINGLALLACSYSVLATDTITSSPENTNLADSRVPTQYLPIEKSTFDNSTQYTFIDKASVQLHPYNKLIRSYMRITNYIPALVYKGEEDKTLSYQSSISHEYVNCAQKEYAKGGVDSYQNYFGEGELVRSSDLPKYWALATGDNEVRSLIVICSLPIND